MFVLSFFIAIINHEAGPLSSVFYPIVGKVKEQNAMIKWLSDYSFEKIKFWYRTSSNLSRNDIGVSLCFLYMRLNKRSPYYRGRS